MIATAALSQLKPAVTSLPSIRVSSYSSSSSQWRPPRPDQSANSRKKNPNPTLLYHIAQTTFSSRAIASLPSIRASSSSSSSSQSQSPDENSRVAVWWDIRRCPVPEGFDLARVPQAIEAAVRANRMKGPVHITAVADVFRAEHSWKTLSDAGVTISHAPHGNFYAMRGQLSFWFERNPPPAHLFLITHWSISTAIYYSRIDEYNILLASDRGPDDEWRWKNDILKGGSLIRMPFNEIEDPPPSYGEEGSDESPPWYSEDYYGIRRDLKILDKWPVVVWWDFDSIPVPSQVIRHKISQSINEVVKLCGMPGRPEMHCFGDAIQLSKYPCAALMAQKCEIDMTHVPNGGKRSARECLLADLKLWTSKNPAPAHLLLITSDPSYASTLRELRESNYNTLVAGDEVPGVLCKEASIVWGLNDLLKGGLWRYEGENWEVVPRYFNQPPDASLYGRYDVPLEQV